MRLAHRPPATAPQHGERWGRSGNPWVASDPLPLHQVARHESERKLRAGRLTYVATRTASSVGAAPGCADASNSGSRRANTVEPFPEHADTEPP